MRMVNAIWRFFYSLKLTAVLLLLLMAGSFLGMFYDQTLSYQQHMSHFAPHSLEAQLFSFFEIYDLFGSWWFQFLVVMLALNLIGCTLNRLPSLWRVVFGYEHQLSDKRLTELSHHVSLQANDYDQAKQTAQKILKEQGGRQEQHKLDDGELLHSEKRRWVRFSVLVVHSSLLLIIFGHVANSIWGTDASMSIREGSKTSTIFVRGPAGLNKRAQLNFAVRCDDFRFETFVNGMPKDYESDLVVVKDGRELIKKTIRVNDPLEYAGYTFYQSSYQPLPGEERVQLQAGPRGGKLKNYTLRIGDRLNLPGGVSFVPVETAKDLGGMGPALRINRVDAQGSAGLTLIKNMPDLDAQRRHGQYELRFLGAQQNYATILSVAHAPATWVVFIGFAMLLLGSLAGMIYSHRRYWIRLRRTKNGAEIILAGVATHHKQAFENEFALVEKQLRQSCKNKKNHAQEKKS